MKARHISIMLWLILVSVPILNAQDLRYGLLGGFDVVTIRQTPLAPHQLFTINPITSYNINGFLSFKSKGVWGISIEPGLIQKGGLNYKSRVEFKYLQMPIFVDIYILRRLSLSIGPEFAYMISAKSINPNSISNISGIYDRKFEFSGSIGLNYILGKRIGIGLKYNHGLTTILKSPLYGDNWEILGWQNNYNEYFQLKLSFRI
jgi:hypothetical protein